MLSHVDAVLPEADSQLVEYQVIHVTPERIRIRISQRLRQPAYESRLKKLVQAFDFVSHVRTNSVAESLVIHYTNVVSTALQQIIDAIQQATNPDIPDLPKVKSTEAPLTPYEQEQIQEIKKWESKEPDFLTSAAGKLFTPIKTGIDLLIPAPALETALKVSETVTLNWQEDWKNLQRIAQVEDYHQLKQVELDFCDRLANRVKGEAVVVAGTTGAITGVFEWAGEIADVPLCLGLGLQTVHRVGLCYGYSPETETEEQFAWAILGVGTANTAEDRKKAMEALQDFQHQLYRQTFDDLVENSVEDSVLESTVDSVFKQIITNLAEGVSGEALPIIGIGIGIVANSSILAEVGEAAHRAFQVRWLVENKKLSSLLTQCPS